MLVGISETLLWLIPFLFHKSKKEVLFSPSLPDTWTELTHQRREVKDFFILTPVLGEIYSPGASCEAKLSTEFLVLRITPCV